jgi:hypothetical protein
MYLSLIAAVLLAAQVPQGSNPPAQSEAKTAVKAGTTEPNGPTPGAKLLAVTRIFVDDFGSDPAAKQIQAMVVNSLSQSKRFIITENKDKADAVLKGTALEKTSQEFHALNDKVAAASSHAAASGSINASTVNGSGTLSGSSNVFQSGSAAAADDSTAATETIDHATVAVRLVAADGDVIWTTTQESRGAKYKGASADAADKVAKQLLNDLDKLQSSAVNTDKTR